MLQKLGASRLVSSAACGADLIALAEAGSLGLRRKVILPFDREYFRKTSVADRPGDWGGLYDQIVEQVQKAGELVIVPEALDERAYSAANRRILDEAISLGQQCHEPVTAMSIWDGVSRGDDDLTAAFAVEARNRGLPVVEVRTDRPDTVKE
jgi:hypothetical protein